MTTGTRHDLDRIEELAHELQQAVVRGLALDDDRFQELWANLQPRTRRVVAAFEGRLGEVGLGPDDALAELALHLLGKLGQWSPAVGTFGAWWQQVSQRHVIDLTRRRSDRATGLEEVAEIADDSPPLESQALERLGDDRLGSVWARYRACQEQLLAESPDRPRTVVRLLAFQWVDLEGLENRAVAAALGIPEYQCHRHRAWVKRELPRVFRSLFPDLAEEDDDA